MNLASVNKCQSKLEFLSARLQLFQVRLRRAVLSLTLLKELSASWTWRLLTLAMPAMRCKPSTPGKWQASVVLRDNFTPCRLRLMLCCKLLKMLRRNPRRLWLMLLVLLMSSEQSRIMPTPRVLQAAKNAEEKSKKAMVDAARLADEL